MKKMIGLFSLLCVLMFASCTNDDEKIPHDNSIVEQGKFLTLTVAMPQGVVDPTGKPGSRVGYDDNTLVLNWEAGDCLLALGFDNGRYLGISEFILAGESGNKTAKFSGYSIVGATEYIVYYKTPNLRFDERNAMTPIANYEGQKQFLKTSTSHLKEYLLIHSEKIPAEDLEKGSVHLKMRNGIMRVDIESAPEQLGEVRTILWENNRETADAHTTTVDFLTKSMDENIDPFEHQGSATVPFKLKSHRESLLSVYLCFDVKLMQLHPGQSITLTLRGESKSYRVSAISKAGKVYKSGARYYAPVSTASKPGFLTNWEEVVF